MNKAVVATNFEGNGMILYHTGEGIKKCIGMYCYSTSDQLVDLGLYDAPDGISIWEGTVEVVTDSEDYELIGTFRELTDDEWTAVCNNKSPFEEVK